MGLVDVAGYTCGRFVDDGNRATEVVEAVIAEHSDLGLGRPLSGDLGNPVTVNPYVTVGDIFYELSVLGNEHELTFVVGVVVDHFHAFIVQDSLMRMMRK